jgi:hypothetical protein
VADHDAGASLFRPVYQDYAHTCAKPCGYGGYWACAGKVTWPAAESRTYAWTECVFDWEKKTGGAGAQVTVCTSCPCPTATNAMVAQGQTDPDGYVTLTCKQALSITGQGTTYCYQVIAPGYLTVFAYIPSPLTKRTGWSVHDTLLPRETWGIELFTPAAQQSNDELAGATYDPTRAIFVSGGVFHCLGSPAPSGGANVSINASDPMVLALNATDAGSDAGLTATTGAAGQSYTVIFFDVPTDGGLTLTTTVPGVGQVSQVAVNAAPNTLVEVPLVPTP